MFVTTATATFDKRAEKEEILTTEEVVDVDIHSLYLHPIISTLSTCQQNSIIKQL